MKIIRNKFLIGILCIVIGVTVGFVLLPKSQDADINMTKVVRLTQDVEAGTKLEEKMLEIATIPAESVPDGASSALEWQRQDCYFSMCRMANRENGFVWLQFLPELLRFF